MKDFMTKFYWQDMGLYWAHRGTPQTLSEWEEYNDQEQPSTKKIVRLIFGTVKLAIGVRDYWLDGRVTYRRLNRWDDYAQGRWPKLQCAALDFINERFYG